MNSRCSLGDYRRNQRYSQCITCSVDSTLLLVLANVIRLYNGNCNQGRSAGTDTTSPRNIGMRKRLKPRVSNSNSNGVTANGYCQRKSISENGRLSSCYFKIQHNWLFFCISLKSHHLWYWVYPTSSSSSSSLVITMITIIIIIPSGRLNTRKSSE